MQQIEWMFVCRFVSDTGNEYDDDVIFLKVDPSSEENISSCS